MCGGENKKYNRVGNEGRITRCPVALCSVCILSPVNSFKCVSVQCLLVSLFEKRSAWLAYNVGCMRRKGIRGHFPIHRYKLCKRVMHLQIALKPLWRMTPC